MTCGQQRTEACYGCFPAGGEQGTVGVQKSQCPVQRQDRRREDILAPQGRIECFEIIATFKTREFRQTCKLLVGKFVVEHPVIGGDRFVPVGFGISEHELPESRPAFRAAFDMQRIVGRAEREVKVWIMRFVWGVVHGGYSFKRFGTGTGSGIW